MQRRRIIIINKNYIWFLVFLVLLAWSLYAEYSQYPAVPAAVHEPIYQGKTGERVAALAFNVDWGEEYIPEILQNLDRYDILATFFPTGTWAKKNPELIKLIASEGHELGNHGYSHKNPGQLNDRELEELILKNEALLENLTGIKTNLFAPPYGVVDDRIARIAYRNGYKTVMWTVDTIDWQRPAPEIIISRILKGLTPGAIILAHPTEPTLKALPEIIEQIKNRQYQFTIVGELIK